MRAFAFTALALAAMFAVAWLYAEGLRLVILVIQALAHSLATGNCR